jgi:hypothetical protein
MKKIAASILLGIIATACITMTTAGLSWNTIGATCPGIPYATTADLRAGFPVHYSASIIPAMGTCGTITSPTTIKDRLKSLVDPLFFVNTGFWAILVFLVLYALQGLKALRR